MTRSVRRLLRAARAAAAALPLVYRLVRDRSAGDLVRTMRSHVRSSGLRGAFRKFRQLGATHPNAGNYSRWVAEHTSTSDALDAMAHAAATLPYQPLISVIAPVYNTDPSLLRACIESVRRQAYPYWELCLADDASTSVATAEVLRSYEGDRRIRITRLAQNSHISAASNAALEMANGEFVAMLDHDDVLAPEALFEVASYLNVHRDADLIYSDEDKLDSTGARCDPHFKPDWSPELFLCYMYTCHLMVLRLSLAQSIGGFRAGYEGAQDYDLALRVATETTRIHHIPKVPLTGG